MVSRSAGRLIGVGIVLVGAVLLGVALVTPWYFYNNQFGTIPGGGANSNRNAEYYLVPVSSGGAIQYSCPSSEVISNFCPISSSYADAGLSHVGSVAGLAFDLAIAGLVVGVIGAIFGVLRRTQPPWVTRVVAMQLAAISLVSAAAASFAVLLPAAFASDFPTSLQGGSGPWSSFSGSTPLITPSGFPMPPISWGPSAGWYLSIAAVATFVVGTVVLVWYRHDLPQAEPSEPATTTVTRATGSGR